MLSLQFKTANIGLQDVAQLSALSARVNRNLFYGKQFGNKTALTSFLCELNNYPAGNKGFDFMVLPCLSIYVHSNLEALKPRLFLCLLHLQSSVKEKLHSSVLELKKHTSKRLKTLSVHFKLAKYTTMLPPILHHCSNSKKWERNMTP